MADVKRCPQYLYTLLLKQSKILYILSYEHQKAEELLHIVKKKNWVCLPLFVTTITHVSKMAKVVQIELHRQNIQSEEEEEEVLILPLKSWMCA